MAKGWPLNLRLRDGIFNPERKRLDRGTYLEASFSWQLPAVRRRLVFALN
jgi:hypothetical protein